MVAGGFLKVSLLSLLLQPVQWLALRIISAFHVNIVLKTMLEYCYLRSSTLQNFFSFRVWDDKFNSTEDDIHISQLAESCGLVASTKLAVTDDGYLLNMQRLTQDDMESRKHGKKKVPVLLIHGLMQDCESFLCCGQQHSLASILVQQGYDVWLGNNRGNRYSNSHVEVSSDSVDYWNFSIDHLANFDLPAMVRCILQTVNGHDNNSNDSYPTNAPTVVDKVVVIGFSQGSAQTLLGLSTSQYLQTHVSLFIALSPPIKLKGFNSTYLASLVTAFPAVVSMLFGRKAMFAKVLNIKNILTPHMFSNLVSRAMFFLFKWRCDNITQTRKPALYQHIFSPSSVLCVLHWFQIMEANVLTNYKYSQADNLVYNTSSSNSPLKMQRDFQGLSTQWSLRWLISLVIGAIWKAIVWTFSCVGSYVMSCASGLISAAVPPYVHSFDFGSNVRSRPPKGQSDDRDRRVTKGPLSPCHPSGAEMLAPTPTTVPSASSLSLSPPSPFPSYDISNIGCPVAIFAGDADGLIDTHNLDKHLPHCIYSHVEPNYEHLDVIWADTAPVNIFPKICSVLEHHDLHTARVSRLRREAAAEALF